MNNRWWMGVVILTIGAGSWSIFGSGSAAQQAPGNEAEIDLTWGVQIPMRDGVKLNATVYKPKGKAARPRQFRR
jgi:predicted acyl esterase